MGGFKNEEVEIIFAGDTYRIMSDPPIEATRMLIELEGLKMDSNENIDKFKEFIATLISVSNPGVDKLKFKESLTLVSCINFVDGYSSLLRGGQKKEETKPEEKENLKETNETNQSAG